MAVNAYLGLDPSHEAALAVVRLGALFAGSGGGAPPAGPVPDAAPLAAREETFDLIWQAVGLTAAPLLNPSSEPEAKRSGERIPLASVAPGDNRDGMTLVQALQQRRSRRNFRPRTIPFRQLSQLLKLLWPYQPGNMIQAGLWSMKSRTFRTASTAFPGRSRLFSATRADSSVRAWAKPPWARTGWAGPT
jgi:hypothetical protein